MNVVYRMRCPGCGLVIMRSYPSTFGDIRKTAMRHLRSGHPFEDRERSLTADGMARAAWLDPLNPPSIGAGA
jgi:hypothetical protein